MILQNDLLIAYTNKYPFVLQKILKQTDYTNINKYASFPRQTEFDENIIERILKIPNIDKEMTDLWNIYKYFNNESALITVE